MKNMAISIVIAIGIVLAVGWFYRSGVSSSVSQNCEADLPHNSDQTEKTLSSPLWPERLSGEKKTHHASRSAVQKHPNASDSLGNVSRRYDDPLPEMEEDALPPGMIEVYDELREIRRTIPDDLAKADDLLSGMEADEQAIEQEKQQADRALERLENDGVIEMASIRSKLDAIETPTTDPRKVPPEFQETFTRSSRAAHELDKAYQRLKNLSEKEERE